MKHEKTFETISKLKDIEIELHRLKNALEMANRALDAQRTWVGLTDEEIDYCVKLKNPEAIVEEVEAKLRQKNGYAEEKNT